MDKSSLPGDRLFGAGLIERVKAADDGRIDARGGARNRFKAFEPDAVMLVLPSLDEWLPEGHLARFNAELLDRLALAPI